MWVDFKKGSINYEESGTGDVLVLLHGFTESLGIWHDFAKILSKKYRIILIDLPGHGKTSVFDEIHTMEFMADTVKAVLDKLSIANAVMIGHSMGGYVSLAFARKYPRLLKGMGLFHSTSLADTDETKEAREKAIEVIKSSHSRFLLSFIPDLFAPESREIYKNEIQLLIDEANNMDPRAIIAAQLGMKERGSTLDVLINAPYPVMFIAGQKDTRIPFENIWVQMALTEIAHALILRNVGHMGYIEAKLQTLNFVDNFTKSCYEVL
ncbi:MAG: alpha/beta hydrolase [Bacteroidetes bacterium]|nr:MAG: alpha/beta hydrolase [Bacteroidota bacterium]